MLLVLVSACSEELLNDQSDRQITINAVMPEYQTRAGLEQKNGSLDLIAKWKEDDEVYLFIEQNKKVYTVAPAKVRNISSDGKTCNIVLSVPSGVKAEEPYLIYGLCDINGTVEKNKVYAESELKRVYWENSSQGFAPVWFKTTGGPMNFSVNFQHLGTYEVLHVKNESKIGISFRHFGFEVNTPWYKSFEKTSLDDPYTLVNNPSDFGDDANSRASHIGIGETVKFLSWYIPSGASVKDARLKATIDGKEYITTNKKSSDVEIQRGHAYHMYATWDGKELKFTNGDIEDELTLSETSIAIQLKEQKTVNITSGSGQYSVKSNNTSVATASLSGTAITVKGVSKGSATITVTDTKTKQTATIAVTVTDGTDMSPGEAIDLGLPSGTLWASCNVGATKPEEYGLYFAWGETKGYTSDASDGHSFNWANYKWCNGDYDKQTKYCTRSSYGNNGFTDNKTELDLEDDAAYVNWGSNWRMPSLDQIQELIDNCNWEWTQLNGVWGRKATSKTNGKSIFLPAAGYRLDTSLDGAGSGGDYWSRTLHSERPCNAYSLYVYSGLVGWEVNFRYYGLSVRPVRQK